jgi:membrane associated rhomboid family serine protease
MFVIPLGDAPNPKGMPVATYAIIAANLLVYALFTLPLGFAPPDAGDPRVAEYLSAVARELPAEISVDRVREQLTQYDLLVFAHGFRPAAPSFIDLISSLFMHAGLLHLVGNMLFLWIYGDNVEHRLGWPRYIGAYLTTGIAATLFHAGFNPASGVPLVGASGAISGILGFYFLWFPHNTVRLLVGFIPFFIRQVQLSARWVLGLYLFIDNLVPWLLMPAGGVAHGAHIGGFMAGLAGAWYFNRSSLGTPKEFRTSLATGTLALAPDSAIARAIAEGRFDVAARDYFALPSERTTRLLQPHDALALAAWLSSHGHASAALTLYQRQLRDFPIGAGAAEAHVNAGLLLLQSFNQPASAYQHLVEALDHDPAPEVADRAREALSLIASKQKFQVRA